MNDPRAPNMGWLTPYIAVREAARAIAFYERAFGFECVGTNEEGGRVMHAEIAWHGQTVLMLAPEGAWGSTARSPATLGVEAPQSFYVYCDDPDAMFAQATAAGAKPLMPPGDMFWGDRMCAVQDPDGYKWSFAVNTKTEI